MSTIVINRDHADDYPADKQVNIMRPSKWGNPFKVGRDGTRDECCDQFEAYFLEKVEDDPEFRKAVMDELKDKILVCCCKPERCHGDFLAEWCDSQAAQDGPAVPFKTDHAGPMFCDDPALQIKWRA